jgi:hypothetical protein
LVAWWNYQRLIAGCDQEIEQQLKAFDDKIDTQAKPLAVVKVKRRKSFGNETIFRFAGILTASSA